MLFCTIVLFKVLYSKIKNVFFIFCLFFMYYLCEKYYKPIRVQYFIADCVSSVPRLTLLGLQIALMNVLSEWNSFVCRRLVVLRQRSLMCLICLFLGLSCLRLCTSWTWVTVFHSHVRRVFSYYVFKYFLRPHLSLFSF